jgi:hypothetical protein
MISAKRFAFAARDRALTLLVLPDFVRERIAVRAYTHRSGGISFDSLAFRVRKTKIALVH